MSSPGKASNWKPHKKVGLIDACVEQVFNISPSFIFGTQ